MKRKRRLIVRAKRWSSVIPEISARHLRRRKQSAYMSMDWLATKRTRRCPDCGEINPVADCKALARPRLHTDLWIAGDSLLPTRNSDEPCWLPDASAFQQ